MIRLVSFVVFVVCVTAAVLDSIFPYILRVNAPIMSTRNVDISSM